MTDRYSQGSGFSDEQIVNFDDSAGFKGRGRQKESSLLQACLPTSNVRETLIRQWRLLTPGLKASAAGARHYAEKVPFWLPSLVRRCFAGFTVYLFRDPRDVFLSANKFMTRRNYLSFGRTAGDSDLNHARHLAPII